jgi:hypothetical protein
VSKPSHGTAAYAITDAVEAEVARARPESRLRGFLGPTLADEMSSSQETGHRPVPKRRHLGLVLGVHGADAMTALDASLASDRSGEQSDTEIRE